MKIISIAGHVKNPGNYELPLGTTFRKAIYEYAGGVQGDKQIKGFYPGGSSTPMLTVEHLDIPMEKFAVEAVGSIMGTAALTVFDEDTNVVEMTHRLLQFYRHESCGKCTPCREGNDWLVAILRRLAENRGKDGDPDVLIDMASNIAGRSFCVFGDAAATPVLSSIKHFRSEYERRITNPPDDKTFIPIEAVGGH